MLPMKDSPCRGRSPCPCLGLPSKDGVPTWFLSWHLCPLARDRSSFLSPEQQGEEGAAAKRSPYSASNFPPIAVHRQCWLAQLRSASCLPAVRFLPFRVESYLSPARW